MAWNRVDIARSEIFTDEWQWKVGLPATLWKGLVGPQEQGGALEGGLWGPPHAGDDGGPRLQRIASNRSARGPPPTALSLSLQSCTP